MHAIDYGMLIQQAVDAPRFHHQWLTDVIDVKNYALSADMRKILEEMGRRLVPAQAAGFMAAIMLGTPSHWAFVDSKLQIYGANDPRRRMGLALGC